MGKYLAKSYDEALRENTALRSRLASTERERDEIMAMAERRDGELQARLAEAERKLRVYGQHLPNCLSLIYLTSMPPKTQPCDCGLVTPDSAPAAAIDWKPIPCPRCFGEGVNYSPSYLNGSAPCLLCGGAGRVVPKGGGSYAKVTAADQPGVTNGD